MKRLTIGSLKPNNNRHSQVQSIVMTKSTFKELKRILEVQQNFSRYKFEVEKGLSVLDTALSKGIPLEYKCKKGTCGKCQIKILNGSTYLYEPNDLEQKKLAQRIHNGYRLACQARTK